MSLLFATKKFPNSLFAQGLSNHLIDLLDNKTTSKNATTHENSIQVEIPIYASLKKASYTIEAAIILPLFISIMVFAMFIFRILQVQAGVQKSIDYASRTMAITLGEVVDEEQTDKEITIVDNSETVSGETALLESTISCCSEEIGKNHVPVAFVDKGVKGFDFLDSSVDGNYIDIKVKYAMTFPVGLLGEYTFDVSQRARCRKWVGYDKSENEFSNKYVYITEGGEVYHNNYYCTYLNPSIHRLPKEDLPKARNKEGAIYYKCKSCGGKVNGFVYVTDYGTAYHSDINCKKITHSIQKVPYESVKDVRRPCSKCIGKNILRRDNLWKQ